MIGKLSGNIDSIGDTYLILDVSGVGYVVNASRSTLSSIGQAGDTLSMLIETQVREDSITLFGFKNAAEQSWFRLLTSVQGVGAKAGLSILSACPPESLAIAIASQDKAVIRRADGVGPKLATRILTELKDKAGKMDISFSAVGNAVQDSKTAVGNSENTDESRIPNADAISALVNLGYARSDAYTAVMNAAGKANDNEKESLQALIRLALKELSA